MNSVWKDIFGPGSCFDKRFIRSYGDIGKKIKALRELGQTITLTMGTWDMLHTGHSRYLERAKESGDVVIVGVDSDKKVRKRKGPNRPFDNEKERLEMLTHCRHVDLVVLKDVNDEKWQLIKIVRPDILIATKETYNDQELEELKKFCGQIVVLEPQASTSTTAKIRLLLVNHLAEFEKGVEDAKEVVSEKLDGVLGLLTRLKGG